MNQSPQDPSGHAIPLGDDTSCVDITAVTAADGTQGALWSRETTDLDVNVVAFPAGSGVAEHVNGEVDVLVVVVAGEGRAEVAGRVHPLAAGVALIIPKGAPRSIRCTAGRLVYLTCHRRRARLTPSRAPHA